MTTRLTKIVDGHWLEPADQCYYIGEYISGGTWKASETNQLISNLKADIRANPRRSQHKTNAISTAAAQLHETLKSDYLRERATVVPMPCSKPRGHAEFDDRVERVVRMLGQRVGQGFDGRALLETSVERNAQHATSTRASVAELVASMSINRALLAPPLRPTVIVVDDVFTLGASFKAAQQLLLGLPGVREVVGVFIARTVWLTPTFDEFFPEI